ncbi:hypothetical protein EXIGLDRAFT_833993 [Exidia glandulosa HHB12029]|uniref:Uncharacterized protein n=1 Tax=Exidia glandulosa HHB12029 TaxID=1314781 RepID=A0A165K8F7_EXIGL|nr:hypothetical protein EXIGLDRAFT_833993 [Exidia glandulosa HHB12029]
MTTLLALDFSHEEHITPMAPHILYLSTIGCSAILTLRLYAFTGGKRYLVVIVFACYLAIVAFHIWVVIHQAILAPAGQACDPSADGNTNELGSIFVRDIHDFTLLVRRLTSGMTKLGAMLLDTFITLAFFTHLLRVMKLKYTQMSVFTRAFLREGAAYFLAISSVNLLNVAFNLQHFAPMADLNVPWSLVLPSLLVSLHLHLLHNMETENDPLGGKACRLVLNLRKVEPENATVGTISLDSRKRWAQTLSNHQDIEIGPRFPHYAFSPASPGADEFYELMHTPSTASRSFSQDSAQASPLQRREFRHGIPSPPPRIYVS